jgi:ribosomal protein S18 acetylase RimI-like enzyme
VVRAAIGDDADVIRRLAVDNGLFAPEDRGEFGEMLTGYLTGSLAQHSWIVLDDAGTVIGAAFYAPEPFRDRVWNLFFIAVDAAQHGAGAGSALVEHVEAKLRSMGEKAARVLIVETLSLDGFEQARRFYSKLGFDEEARVREFYGPGDDKVVFWKGLVTAAPS